MADGHTHSWQESDHWWGMIGCGMGRGGSTVCVCVCLRVSARARAHLCVHVRSALRVGVGLNEPVWGLNTGGLTTAE